MDPIQIRYNRGNLVPGKEYYKIHNREKSFAGTFVRLVRSGSGDGMTISVEFLLNDKTYYVDEEMWGSLNGSELTYFVEA